MNKKKIGGKKITAANYDRNEKNYYMTHACVEEFTCANCGNVARIPFRPREDRPVYCSECFAQLKQNEG